MNRSDSIAKLSEALGKAQSQITGAIRDSDNPFFKSKYADLESVMAAIREPFAKNNLSYTQTGSYLGDKLILVTTLMHSSGEWLSSDYPIVCKDMTDAQKIGAGMTYARRFSLAAIAGVAQVDDDGNEAAAKETKPLVNHAPKPQGSPQWSETAKQGAEHVKEGRVITDAQLRRLEAIRSKSGKSHKDVVDKSHLLFKKEVRQLNMMEYDILVAWAESVD